MSSVLTVDIIDVDEVPLIDNLPATVNVSEDSTGSETIFTVSATDPEGNALTYNLANTDPAGGPFSITSTGK